MKGLFSCLSLVSWLLLSMVFDDAKAAGASRDKGEPPKSRGRPKPMDGDAGNGGAGAGSGAGGSSSATPQNRRSKPVKRPPAKRGDQDEAENASDGKRRAKPNGSTTEDQRKPRRNRVHFEVSKGGVRYRLSFFFSST